MDKAPLFDIAWFERREFWPGLASRLKRMPVEEIRARSLELCQGWRFFFDLAIPAQLGITGTRRGFAAVRNFLGSVDLGPWLQTENGRLRLAESLQVLSVEAGAAVANFLPGVLEHETWRESARKQGADEAANRAELARQRQKRVETQGAAAEEGLMRWVNIVGLLCGVRSPKRLSAEEAQDLALAMTLTGEREIPGALAFLSALGTDLQPPEPGRERSVPISDDPMDALREAEQAVSQMVR